jgi:hypothetical protein
MLIFNNNNNNNNNENDNLFTGLGVEIDTPVTTSTALLVTLGKFPTPLKVSIATKSFQRH